MLGWWGRVGGVGWVGVMVGGGWWWVGVGVVGWVVCGVGRGVGW